MRMTRKAAIYATTKKEPVALTVTKKQWTGREADGGLLNNGTVGHAYTTYYAMALTFTAPKNMSRVTLGISGTHNNYQRGVAYRCGVAAYLPDNNATGGTVFYEPTASGGTVSATVTLKQNFSAGKEYTVWLWSSGNATGGYDFINKLTITMEGV